ncbi:hypothetical protein K1T71_009062 [Dendrolimus kikuchii]|uniref:Uncharacterized protein n=1 Tax=Dendrolimus kikuchii TaxID=765133 RepID=A0ACC1CTP6_9NEOP|nr:hypothetical protein K1T71_009062 [Dendrolimus kikuchii]
MSLDIHGHETLTIKVGEDFLKQVDKFRYLGNTVTSKGALSGSSVIRVAPNCPCLGREARREGSAHPWGRAGRGGVRSKAPFRRSSSKLTRWRELIQKQDHESAVVRLMSARQGSLPLLQSKLAITLIS